MTLQNIEDNSIVVGNPMRVVGTLDANLTKNKQLLDEAPIFSQNYHMTEAEKLKMKKYLENTIGYVKCETWIWVVFGIKTI